MHIGMIGGIGPAATEFYYKNLVQVYKSNNKLIDLTIVHAEISDLMANISINTPEEQARIFLKLALRLKAAGAEVIAISSIAGHFCLPEFEKISPLPIVSAISSLESELFKRGIKRIGLLGHRVAMESKLYGGISFSEVVIPLADDLDKVHSEYVQIATTGIATDSQRELFFSVGKELCDKQKADAVVLAGTDLFLAFDGHSCDFTTIDIALVHINALFNESCPTKT